MKDRDIIVTFYIVASKENKEVEYALNEAASMLERQLEAASVRYEYKEEF